METDEEKKVREEKEVADKAAAEEKEKEAAAASAEAEKKKKEEETGVKSPLQEARDLDQSIKESTKKMGELIKKNEKIMADAAISGKGFAGQSQPPTKTDDEKWVEDARKRYEGTGMDPTPEKDSGPTIYR